MSQITPPTIDPAPAVPIRGTPAFKGLVDAFLTWLALAVTQFQMLATNAYNNAVDAYNNALIASAQAAAAVAAVNASIWVGGTSHVAGASASVRYSPADGRTYRCILATSGTTDPSGDPTHWVCISAGILPYLHVRDQKANGSNGGAATGAPAFFTRTLNTTVGTITIGGASLGSNQVVLPAGTYEMSASAPASQVNYHKLSLYNVTDSVDVLVGAGSFCAGQIGQIVTVVGRFTLTSTKSISLRHYISTSTNSADLGFGATSGQPEVFAQLQIWKVA